MPFALDSNPTQSEVSEAINYLLANFASNFVSDPVTGQITVPGGFVFAYLYKYIAVKYADSIDGSTNFSNTPTNRQYYGVRNTDSSVESTNPVDYVWTKVSGGFGTTKFLYYQTNGGRQIQFVIATTAPDSTWKVDSGTSIDLDIITGTNGIMAAFPTIYQWTASSTPPTRPSTTSTYTWLTGAYTAPTGWTTVPALNTTPGYYLWSLTVPLIVSVNTTTSVIDWTNTGNPIISIAYNGANGTNGANGATGPRSSTGYLYYQFASASAPSSPSASGYNFTNNTFSSVTANWTTSFSAPAPSTNPSTQAGSKFWAVRYSVSEATYGGSQTVTISAVFNWQNLDGLVTFTNVSAPSGTTFIDGGNIITNSVVANKLAAGTATVATGKYFGLGTSDTIAGISGSGFFNSTAASTSGLITASTTSTGILGGTTTSGVQAAGFYNATSTAYTSFRTYAELATGTVAGYFINVANNHWIELANNTYAYQTQGGASGTFTGAHDGLLLKTAIQPVEGDIILDDYTYAAPNVYDTISVNSVSTSANQQNVLGVFANYAGEGHVPTALGINVTDPNTGISTFVINPIYEPDVNNYNMLVINGVGEGQINVCGEGGNILAGDMICTSSMVGKGMKQSDDFVRSITVAKSRENVTFSGPTEVKMISCIYLAG